MELAKAVAEDAWAEAKLSLNYYSLLLETMIFADGSPIAVQHHGAPSGRFKKKNAADAESVERERFQKGSAWLLLRWDAEFLNVSFVMLLFDCVEHVPANKSQLRVGSPHPWREAGRRFLSARNRHHRAVCCLRADSQPSTGTHCCLQPAL